MGKARSRQNPSAEGVLRDQGWRSGLRRRLLQVDRSQPTIRGAVLPCHAISFSFTSTSFTSTNRPRPASRGHRCVVGSRVRIGRMQHRSGYSGRCRSLTGGAKHRITTEKAPASQPRGPKPPVGLVDLCADDGGDGKRPGLLIGSFTRHGRKIPKMFAGAADRLRRSSVL